MYSLSVLSTVRQRVPEALSLCRRVPQDPPLVPWNPPNKRIIHGLLPLSQQAVDSATPPTIYRYPSPAFQCQYPNTNSTPLLYSQEPLGINWPCMITDVYKNLVLFLDPLVCLILIQQLSIILWISLELLHTMSDCIATGRAILSLKLLSLSLSTIWWSSLSYGPTCTYFLQYNIWFFAVIAS